MSEQREATTVNRVAEKEREREPLEIWEDEVKQKRTEVALCHLASKSYEVAESAKTTTTTTMTTTRTAEFTLELMH